MTSILIVDDDNTLINLLEYKFGHLGYEVTVQQDGALAQDALRSRVFDVLLLDIMMPRIDGFQVLREIAEGKLKRPRATLVLSARGEEKDILLAFNLGAVDYVTKPFSLNVLTARVEIALRHKSVATPEN
jgi:DNA-binding response OmpR family regulator